MEISLNLVLPVIIDSVESETYLKGRYDRASDERANGIAYHETAGGEDVHRRKILRNIYTSVDNLTAYMNNYIANKGYCVGDNVTSEINETAETITITLNVSNRFNKANTEPLARKCSEYIEMRTLYLWWIPFSKEQAQYYYALCEEVLGNLTRLFTKSAPNAPQPYYTLNLDCETSALSMFIGDKAEVEYSIDQYVINDIVAESSNKKVATVERSDSHVAITAAGVGECTIKMFSLHNTDVKHEISINVTKQ